MTTASAPPEDASDSRAFITMLDPDPGCEIRLAVKDCIDVAGVVTTAGNAALASHGAPAKGDAACLVGARTVGVGIVGKTNLHELCFGATGVNPHFGTPQNPLDPTRIPGGSSSGSAVAVARGWADVALGTDTAGSIRNPAACCGVVGLKTTHGRISTQGTRPLAPSMDCIGPIATSMFGIVLGMEMLESGFAVPPPVDPANVRIGRFRGVEADERIDRAIDAALAATGWTVVDVDLPRWSQADVDGRLMMYYEALRVNASFLQSHRDSLGDDVADRFVEAATISESDFAEVCKRQPRWRNDLAAALAPFDAIALPSYPTFPPVIGEHQSASNTAAVAVSLSGNPALSLPVPTSDGPATTTGRPFPGSLQLVALHGGDEQLIRLGVHLETVVRSLPQP